MGEEARKQGLSEWENVTQAGEGDSGFVTGEVCTEQGGVVQQSVVTGVGLEQKQRTWRGSGSKIVRRTEKRPGKVKTCRRKTEKLKTYVMRKKKGAIETEDMKVVCDENQAQDYL